MVLKRIMRASGCRLRLKTEISGIFGYFPFCQRFRKFRSEFKWKGSFQFVLTGIFRITSGVGPHISFGVFRPKFSVLFMTNRFLALIWEFGRRIKNNNSHFYWLARFNRKMQFHFPQVFPRISDRSVWHNGEHPLAQRKLSNPGFNQIRTFIVLQDNLVLSTELIM